MLVASAAALLLLTVLLALAVNGLMTVPVALVAESRDVRSEEPLAFLAAPVGRPAAVLLAATSPTLALLLLLVPTTLLFRGIERLALLIVALRSARGFEEDARLRLLEVELVLAREKLDDRLVVREEGFEVVAGEDSGGHVGDGRLFGLADRNELLEGFVQESGVGCDVAIVLEVGAGDDGGEIEDLERVEALVLLGDPVHQRMRFLNVIRHAGLVEGRERVPDDDVALELEVGPAVVVAQDLLLLGERVRRRESRLVTCLGRVWTAVGDVRLGSQAPTLGVDELRLELLFPFMIPGSSRVLIWLLPFPFCPSPFLFPRSLFVLM